MMRKTLAAIILGFACGFSFGATSDAPNFEMSFDGLYRRQSNVFSELWVRKQFNVHDYHQVMLVPSFIEYRPYRAPSDPNAPQSSPPTKRQQESLAKIVNAAFREELAKSKYFKLVDEPGPDVLTVRGDLVDVVSYVPANGNESTDALTVPVAGEAILVIELYDSSSNAIMVRASDKVAAKREADTKTADEAVRATATAWARSFCERLDQAASIPVTPSHM